MPSLPYPVQNVYHLFIQCIHAVYDTFASYFLVFSKIIELPHGLRNLDCMLTDESKASDGNNSDMQNKKPKILKHFIDFFSIA